MYPLGDKWNLEVSLKEAMAKGGETAPTCADCHFEYQGKFAITSCARSAGPTIPSVPGIRENIKTEWAEKRNDAWVKTCTNCHSERTARAWMEFMDNGTFSGPDKYDEAHHVVEEQYKSGLLTGQKTNRPAPPAPETEMV